MNSIDPAPTFDELTEAARPYLYINSIADLAGRVEEARRALLAMVAPEHRLAAGHLASVIEAAAEAYVDAVAWEELGTVAAHFPGLDLAILGIYHHVRASAGGARRCSCPAGEAAPTAAGPA